MFYKIYKYENNSYSNSYDYSAFLIFLDFSFFSIFSVFYANEVFVFLPSYL